MDATDVSQRDEVEPDESSDGHETPAPFTRGPRTATHATGVEQAKENARNDPPA